MSNVPRVTKLDTAAAILLMVSMVSLMISFLLFKNVLSHLPPPETQQEAQEHR